MWRSSQSLTRALKLYANAATNEMHTNYSIPSFALCSALLLTFVGCTTSKPSRVNRESAQGTIVSCRFLPRNVVVYTRSESLRIEELDGLAQQHLKRKFPDFPPPAQLSLWAWISTSDSRRAVVLEYSSGVGEPCWQVTFDAGGKLRGSKKGIVHETIGPGADQ